MDRPLLSGQQRTPLPTVGEKIGQLVLLLRERRCLLILDNLETLMEEGARAGQFRDGFADYAALLQRLGESAHQSCTVLTSREKPAMLGPLEGRTAPVRTLLLHGVDVGPARPEALDLQAGHRGDPSRDQRHAQSFIVYSDLDPDLMTPQMEQFLAMFEQAGSPFYLYTRDECIALSQPWQLPSSGLVPLQAFLGLPSNYITEEDREGVGLEFYAAILEKDAPLMSFDERNR